MQAPIDLSTATAIDIIGRSILMHPSLFREALANSRADDNRYAAIVHETDKRTWNAVKGRAGATGRAIEYVEDENAESFAADLSAGIIALNIACKLQCLPPHIRTAAALRTWEA
jgi:hypothetical protein